MKTILPPRRQLAQLPPYLLLLFATVLLLTGCAPQVVTVTVTSPPETVVVTATASPSPLPTPPGPKSLTICLVGEPDTLYLYGGSHIPATRHVLEALYDGPIDYLNYSYHPVILQETPSVAEGDVVTRRVRVQKGFRVLDTAGQVVELADGVRVRPAGCYADDCAVEFADHPLLMERMEVTFRLREDVTWADGEPLTADDSLFAFQVASDPATPGSRYLTERTDRYRTLGDWRVQWTGIPGFLPPDYPLTFFAPLPRHQLAGRSPADLAQSGDIRRAPLGWGPFVVAEWAAGDHITLTRNPYYFRADEGLPYLDQVVFRFTGGAADMMADLLAGTCDVAVQDGDFEPFMPLLMQSEQDGLLKVVSAPGNGWEHIDFGVSPAPDYRRPDFFGDVRTRQAIVQCIDRQAIADEVAYGRSAVSDSYLPPDHPLYPDAELAHWGYDPDSGRALLEEIGWVDDDQDGVREAHRVSGVPGGVPFEIALLTSADDALAQQIARIVRAYLADCGIRLDLQSVPVAEFLAPGPDGPFMGRHFDLVGTTWWFDLYPPCEHYLSTEIPARGRWYGANPSGYGNPDYDAACQTGLQALPGTAEYDEYHRQAQIIFSQELPAIPLFARLRIAVTRPGVQNFSLDSTARSDLWDIEMLDLE